MLAILVFGYKFFDQLQPHLSLFLDMTYHNIKRERRLECLSSPLPILPQRQKKKKEEEKKENEKERRAHGVEESKDQKLTESEAACRVT